MSSFPETSSNKSKDDYGFNSQLDDVLYSAEKPTYIHYEINSLPKKRTVPILHPTLQTPESTTISGKFPQGFRRLSNAEFNNKPALRRYCNHGKTTIRTTKDGSRWLKCQCYQGYNGPKCNISINFCAEYQRLHSQRPCEHYCVNTASMFMCTCANGYELDENERDCSRADDFYFKLLNGSRHKQKTQIQPNKSLVRKKPSSQHNRNYNNRYVGRNLYQNRRNIGNRRRTYSRQRDATGKYFISTHRNV